jgi:hypothetical protein
MPQNQGKTGFDELAERFQIAALPKKEDTQRTKVFGDGGLPLRVIRLAGDAKGGN